MNPNLDKQRREEEDVDSSVTYTHPNVASMKWMEMTDMVPFNQIKGP